MRTLLIGLSLICISLSSFSQQVAKGLTASNGKYIGFYQYTPANYNAGTKYPLIIFLHGIGERGNGTSDLPRVLANAIPRSINYGADMTFTYNGQKSTFLVLSPQLDNQYGSWEPFYVDEMIKYATNNLSIDPDRIYLTGLSLGGGGTWRWATASAANASKLAAIAPVCGTGEGTGYCNLTQNKLGIWAFHAKDDYVVGVGNTLFAEAKIKECDPNYPAKYTYYDSGGHGIWERAYTMDHSEQSPLNIFEWFLSQTKKGNNANNGNGKPNTAPLAVAGADVAISYPATSAVTLNGNPSYDEDGTITSYTWTYLSGPAGSYLGSPASASTTVNNLVPGTYVVRLTVTDNGGATATDDVTITVNNTQTNTTPTANAGADINITLPNSSINLDGSGSKDSDGSIVSYAWSKVSGPASFTIAALNAVTSSVTGLLQGNYVFRLTVTDDKGATATDDVNVTVNALVSRPTNQAPVAWAGNDLGMTLPMDSIYLNGFASKDNDGQIVAYQWSQAAGPTQATLSTAGNVGTWIKKMVAGVYKFTLKVTDDQGATGTHTVAITINSNSNAAVVTVNAGSDATLALPANSISLTGAAISPNGPIVSYAWSQVSGPNTAAITNAGEVKCNIAGLIQGDYIFKLEAKDNLGLTGSSTVKVSVIINTSSNKPPVAWAGSDFGMSLPYSSLILDAFASKDYDGYIVAYKWSIISGPAQGYLETPDNRSTWMRNMAIGTYQFKLVVTDNGGATNADTVAITVNPASAKVATATTTKAVKTATDVAGIAVTDAKTSVSLNTTETKLFPNPANSIVNLQFNDKYEGVVKITVYDQGGRVVKVISAVKNGALLQKQIDVSNLTQGSYFAEINTGNKKPISLKFIKR
jgi:poly(3-hydroxybutyrate) depolymerase